MSASNRPTFTASRKRVYEALTDSGQFDKVTQAIVRFELLDLSPGTRIVFDHTGFPTGNAAHLAAGWHAHYWDPLEKILAAG